nr:hypothetical protein [Tanacetum cinerariifolium]
MLKIPQSPKWTKGVGHSKASYDKEPVPKAPIQRRPPGRTRQSVFGTHASARGRGRGSTDRRDGTSGRNRFGEVLEVLMDEDEITLNLEHEYMQDMLDAEKAKREQKDREYQERLDEEVFQEAIEQQSMFEQMDEERETPNKEQREWEEGMIISILATRLKKIP